MWPENPRKFRESSAKDPRTPWLAGMAPPFDIGEWNQRFQDALHCGKRGTFVTCFPRKLAKVYFRHMDAAKEKPCIGKGSRKRWRKGRQNRTQGNGVLATAQMVLWYLLRIWFVAGYLRLAMFFCRYLAYKKPMQELNRLNFIPCSFQKIHHGCFIQPSVLFAPKR